MTLIKSISGIRGTIGGRPENNLTPLDTVKFAAAFGSYMQSQSKETKMTIVIGRDARISGEMIQSLVMQTLVGMGIDIIDLGLSTTPTVEMAVVDNKAQGGIILTASHNPKHWNALKLLDAKGEFLDAAAGANILSLAETEDFIFAEVDHLGQIKQDNTAIDQHIKAVLAHPLIDLAAIKARKQRTTRRFCRRISPSLICVKE